MENRVEIDNITIEEFVIRAVSMKFDRWYYSREDQKGFVILK